MLSDEIQEEIRRLEARIARLKKLLYFVAEHRLDEIKYATLYCDGIDVNRPNRETFKQVRERLPKCLKWRKEPDDAAVTYTTEVDGITIRMWRAEPPPSCRVVYKEVLIPARVERVPELVCDKGEPKDD